MNAAVDADLFAYIFSDDASANPYDLFARMREQAPCFDSVVGIRFVPSYRTALDVIHDPSFSNDVRRWRLYDELTTLDEREMFFWRAAAPQLLLIDPPDHTRIRHLLSKAFTYRTVADMAPAIERIVDASLRALPDEGELDVMTEFAHRIPVQVIGGLMGVPSDELELFAGLARTLALQLDPMQMFLSDEVAARSDEAALVFAQYVDDLISRRRRRRGDDLISKLIAVEEEGDRLSPEELGAGCALLLIAGLDTTSNLLGSGIAVLAEGGPALDTLRAEPAHWPAAIEEVLRLESPVQATARIACQPTAVGGESVEPGEMVVVLNGAANRDPEEFASPDEVDLHRTPNAHIAFGHGAHHCLGAALARRQAAVALPAFFEHFEHVDVVPDTLRWRRTFSFRGPAALNVTVRR